MEHQRHVLHQYNVSQPENTTETAPEELSKKLSPQSSPSPEPLPPPSPRATQPRDLQSANSTVTRAQYVGECQVSPGICLHKTPQLSPVRETDYETELLSFSALLPVLPSPPRLPHQSHPHIHHLFSLPQVDQPCCSDSPPPDCHLRRLEHSETQFTDQTHLADLLKTDEQVSRLAVCCLSLHSTPSSHNLGASPFHSPRL